MIIRTEQGWRRLFASAALFNLGVAALFGFGGDALFSRLGVAPRPQPALWFELAMLAVAVFGLGYYGVARDLGQTLVVRMGAIGKVGFVIVIVGQWLAGNASWQLVALVMGDFVYALFFFDFLCNASGFRHKTSPQSSGRHA